MRLLFAGNFNITAGTGYANILAGICSQLGNNGHEIWILGEFWDKSEHDYPFTVLPSDYNWIPAQALAIQRVRGIDYTILTMDLPKIAHLLHQSGAWQQWESPTAAIFPIESTPILSKWATAAGDLHKIFVISRFGQRALADVGLEADYLPVTAKVPRQAMTKNSARLGLYANYKGRMLGNPEILREPERLLLATVADNQERKDLPVIGQAVRILKERGLPIAWLLLTAVEATNAGWHFPELLDQLGISDVSAVLSWGIPAYHLGLVYTAADWFVLASQAEGACLPIYEAMAHGTPVIAPDHTAITEALSGGLGVLIPPAYSKVHPFGNCTRYHVAPEDLADAIESARPPDPEQLIDFIIRRPWSLAARIIEEGLENDEKTEGDTSESEERVEETAQGQADHTP